MTPDHDSEANAEMTRDNVRAVFATKMQARLERQQDECSHAEHDHGICIECGKDITDRLVEQAENAADAAQDR